MPADDLRRACRRLRALLWPLGNAGIGTGSVAVDASPMVPFTAERSICEELGGQACAPSRFSATTSDAATAMNRAHAGRYST